MITVYAIRPTPAILPWRLTTNASGERSARALPMAMGHLLAVTTKLALGILEGSVGVFYTIGAVLAVPAWWLIYHAPRVLTDDGHGRATLVLNAWLALSLLTLGVHHVPLAAPALLNIGYHLHSRPSSGWAIMGVAVVVNMGLLVGSLIFLASGQSFEQFRGIG